MVTVNHSDLKFVFDLTRARWVVWRAAPEESPTPRSHTSPRWRTAWPPSRPWWAATSDSGCDWPRLCQSETPSRRAAKWKKNCIWCLPYPRNPKNIHSTIMPSNVSAFEDINNKSYIQYTHTNAYTPISKVSKSMSFQQSLAPFVLAWALWHLKGQRALQLRGAIPTGVRCLLASSG